MAEAIIAEAKFQELTSISFGIRFLTQITKLGCKLRDCSFFALIHFNSIKLEVVISVAESKLTIETFNEGTFVRNKTVNDFLENAFNYNNLINALISYCNKSNIKYVKCLTDNDVQIGVLSSLGFTEEELPDSDDPCWIKEVSPVAISSDNYSLTSLRESFSEFGLDLTNVYFAAVMDFDGLGDYHGRSGRIEYRYRLINNRPAISIFDAMDFVGIHEATGMLQTHLEESYGTKLEIIM